MPKRKLTPKQQRFVDEYLIDCNAAAAYNRSGYKAHGAAARANASRMLTNANVAAAIQAGQQARSQRTGLTQDYVLDNLTEVVERCMQRAPVCNSKGEQITDEDGKAIWTFNAKGAIGALALLGKQLGMFKDRVQIDGPPYKLYAGFDPQQVVCPPSPPPDLKK